MSHIVIIGSGVAGCSVLRCLRKHQCSAEITVIAPHSMLYYASGAEAVLSGRRRLDNVSYELKTFFTHHQANFVSASVSGIDTQARTVFSSAGMVSYDTLVIASGAHYPDDMRGQSLALNCEKNAIDLTALLNYVEANDTGSIAFGFSAANNSSLLSQPVVRQVLALDEYLRDHGKRGQFSLNVFTDTDYAQMADQLHLSARSIGFYSSAAIRRFDKSGVQMVLEHIAAERIIYMSEPRGGVWLRGSQLPLDKSGFIQCDDNGVVQHQPAIFTLGAAASPFHQKTLYSGHALLHVIEQSANRIAQSIMLHLEPPKVTHMQKKMENTQKIQQFIYQRMINIPDRSLLTESMSYFLEWRYLRHYRVTTSKVM